GVRKTMAGKSLSHIHLNSFLRSSTRVTFESPVIPPSHQAPSKSASTISRDHPSSGAQYSEISAKDSSGLEVKNIGHCRAIRIMRNVGAEPALPGCNPSAAI